MYIFLGLLFAVATNLPEPSSFIFHLCESNVIVYASGKTLSMATLGFTM
jgi:hypothetical protein